MCSSNNGKLWDGYEPDQSILGAIAKLENPDIFMHGCMYIPQEPDERKNFRFKDQLDELMEVGIDGVKICDFKPDSYRLFEVEKTLRNMTNISVIAKNMMFICAGTWQTLKISGTRIGFLTK